MNAQQSFLAEVDAFLKRHEMSDSRFGKEALKDPNFVLELRGGRSPGINTVEEVRTFMLSYKVKKKIKA